MALIYGSGGQEAYYALPVSEIKNALKPSLKDLVTRTVDRHRKTKNREAYANYILLVMIALLSTLVISGPSGLFVCAGIVITTTIAYELFVLSRDFWRSKAHPLRIIHQDQLSKLELAAKGSRFDLDSTEWHYLESAVKWAAERRFITGYAATNTLHSHLRLEQLDQEVKEVVDKYLRSASESIDDKHKSTSLAYMSAMEILEIIEDDIGIDHLDISSLHISRDEEG